MALGPRTRGAPQLTFQGVGVNAQAPLISLSAGQTIDGRADAFRALSDSLIATADESRRDVFQVARGEMQRRLDDIYAEVTADPDKRADWRRTMQDRGEEVLQETLESSGLGGSYAEVLRLDLREASSRAHRQSQDVSYQLQDEAFRRQQAGVEMAAYEAAVRTELEQRPDAYRSWSEAYERRIDAKARELAEKYGQGSEMHRKMLTLDLGRSVAVGENAMRQQQLQVRREAETAQAKEMVENSLLVAGTSAGQIGPMATRLADFLGTTSIIEPERNRIVNDFLERAHQQRIQGSMARDPMSVTPEAINANPYLSGGAKLSLTQTLAALQAQAQSQGRAAAAARLLDVEAQEKRVLSGIATSLSVQPAEAQQAIAMIAQRMRDLAPGLSPDRAQRVLARADELEAGIAKAAETHFAVRDTLANANSLETFDRLAEEFKTSPAFRSPDYEPFRGDFDALQKNLRRQLVREKGGAGEMDWFGGPDSDGAVEYWEDRMTDRVDGRGNPVDVTQPGVERVRWLLEEAFDQPLQPGQPLTGRDVLLATIESARHIPDPMKGALRQSIDTALRQPLTAASAARIGGYIRFLQDASQMGPNAWSGDRLLSQMHDIGLAFPTLPPDQLAAKAQAWLSATGGGEPRQLALGSEAEQRELAGQMILSTLSGVDKIGLIFRTPAIAETLIDTVLARARYEVSVNRLLLPADASQQDIDRIALQQAASQIRQNVAFRRIKVQGYALADRFIMESQSPQSYYGKDIHGHEDWVWDALKADLYAARSTPADELAAAGTSQAADMQSKMVRVRAQLTMTEGGWSNLPLSFNSVGLAAGAMLRALSPNRNIGALVRGETTVEPGLSEGVVAAGTARDFTLAEAVDMGIVMAEPIPGSRAPGDPEGRPAFRVFYYNEAGEMVDLMPDGYWAPTRSSYKDWLKNGPKLAVETFDAANYPDTLQGIMKEDRARWEAQRRALADQPPPWLDPQMQRRDFLRETPPEMDPNRFLRREHMEIQTDLKVGGAPQSGMTLR